MFSRAMLSYDIPPYRIVGSLDLYTKINTHLILNLSLSCFLSPFLSPFLAHSLSLPLSRFLSPSSSLLFSLTLSLSVIIFLSLALNCNHHLQSCTSWLLHNYFRVPFSLYLHNQMNVQYVYIEFDQKIFTAVSATGSTFHFHKTVNRNKLEELSTTENHLKHSDLQLPGGSTAGKIKFSCRGVSVLSRAGSSPSPCVCQAGRGLFN